MFVLILLLKFNLINKINAFSCTDNSNTNAIFNDNYCDCKDGSDEPYTNACFIGEFKCNNHNNPLIEPQTIPNYQIDDGVCDCPDGSDEKPNICSDRSEEILQQEINNLKFNINLHEQGSIIRKNITEKGKKIKRHFDKQIRKIESSLSIVSNDLQNFQESEGDPKLFYEMRSKYNQLSQQLDRLQYLSTLKLPFILVEWYELAQYCYRVVLNEKQIKGGSPVPGSNKYYVTEFCPLTRVSQWELQADINPSQVEKTVEWNKPESSNKQIIGRFNGWNENELNTIIYTGGGRCPNGVSRYIRIKSICGLESILESVIENGMCEYEAIFSTPAECSIEQSDLLKEKIKVFGNQYLEKDEL